MCVLLYLSVEGYEDPHYLDYNMNIFNYNNKYNILISKRKKTNTKFIMRN